MDGELLRSGLIFYLILFASLILRSFSQAWLADRLGDPTPRAEGQVTLYPVPHVDLFGTVIFPLVFIFYLSPHVSQANISFFLAWTRPVPINPSNFANPRRGVLATQFAGFGMSVLISLATAVGGGLLVRHSPNAFEAVADLIQINAVLIFLDLLPLPPLPGGVLLRHWGWIKEETFWAIARWSGLAIVVAFNVPYVRAVIGLLIALIQLPFAVIYHQIAP